MRTLKLLVAGLIFAGMSVGSSWQCMPSGLHTTDVTGAQFAAPACGTSFSCFARPVPTPLPIPK